MMKQMFKMFIYPDKHDEYKKRHSQLWPEMRTMLKDYGVCSYSIYLDKDKNELIAYLEVKDPEKWQESSKTEINQKWWHYMADIMETNPDESPIVKDMDIVFDLE
ncbi:L-rhamnose mutarotase [Agrilactobacillus yilanensis]|uniref:L-rhamnose mutarotase n=1 Tax=Agrilactobacillus yilanensis TaxID=2485997 RepID=A0ABW4J8N0_9LACO|nr:L-rhamnose mutarotase [Agrilactobacillus yilanensis]